MQQNTTDYIAKLAYTTTKDHWKKLVGLPVTVTAGAFAILGLLDKIGENTAPIISLMALIGLGLFVFMICFGTAVTKWTETIYKGKKTIDIEEGLRYGLTRFWGVIGTWLLTMLKTFLWALLLLIPGYYKGITYSFSIKISQLEKISGGNANRLSQMLVKNSGFLRTLGNIASIGIIIGLFFYIYLLASLLLGGVFTSANESIGIILMTILFSIGTAVSAVFMMIFKNYEYLLYKEENKTEFAEMLKKLKKV